MSLPREASASASENARLEHRRQKKGDCYLFELEFAPSLRLVPIVRRFVSDFYGEVFEDAEVISRVVLATHELMENAVRHNSGSEARLMVELRDDEGAKHLAVRIGNPAWPESIDKLTRLLDSMERAQDPFQFYLQLMDQTARQVEGSGLGLTRIRVEGEMHLSHTVQGSWVEVTASTTCPARLS